MEPYDAALDLRSELRLVIERLVRRVAGMAVGRIAFGLLLVALIPFVMVIAVAVFAVLGVAVFGLYGLLGEPEMLASVVGIVWFLGSLLLVFLILLRGHRWLRRLVALAEAPAALIDPYGDESIVKASRPTTWGEAPDPSTFRDRLAAADARHAPPEDDELTLY